MSSFADQKPEKSNRSAGDGTVAASEARIAPATMPVSAIHRGMRGVAYTVFEGTKPEPMDVEILGVLS
ncbi:MAG TPA: hypothetical protein VFZ99_05515, partial [Terriglobales bacterium]